MCRKIPWSKTLKATPLIPLVLLVCAAPLVARAGVSVDAVTVSNSGNSTYSVAPDWANRSVNYVSWGNAARHFDWMRNGQPMGVRVPGASQDLRTDCPSDWLHTEGLSFPGINGVVYALIEYDDGNGPALYAGGWFTLADLH